MKIGYSRSFACVFTLILFHLSLVRAAQNPEQLPSFRLVLSGGLEGVQSGLHAFYDSPLFRLGAILDAQHGHLVIDDAAMTVARAGGFLFFSDSKLSIQEWQAFLRARPKIIEQGRVQSILGQALVGVGFATNPLRIKSFSGGLLSRELGAIFREATWILLDDGQRKVIAFNPEGNEHFDWEKVAADLSELPAARGHYSETNEAMMFIARPLGMTGRALGEVDRLLHLNDGIPSRYADLGNSLSGPTEEHPNESKVMLELLLKRRPVALAAGPFDIAEINYHPGILSKGPYILAAKGEGLPPQSRAEQIGTHQVQFSAIGEIVEQAGVFLPADTRSLTIGESIAQAQNVASRNRADVVFATVQTGDAMDVAIRSPVFDAVLALVSGRRGALPALDDIDVRQNRKDGLRSVAPLVRVSSSDVTEILFWVTKNGELERLRIVRHALLENGPVAQDAAESLRSIVKSAEQGAGLPKRSQLNASKEAWESRELDQILGGFLLDSSKAEIAIVERLSELTPILSELPAPLAIALVERSGRAGVVDLRGRYVRRIFKLIRENQLGVPATLVGGHLRANTIALRAIVDTEWYRIVATENVLFSIYRFMEREGLFAGKKYSAQTLQNTFFDADKEPLKVLEAVRRREGRESNANLAAKEEVFRAAMSLSEIVEKRFLEGVSTQEVDRLLQAADGSASPTFVIDIGDLDLGFMGNFINDNLKNFKTDSDAAGKGRDLAITESRLRDPAYLRYLIFTNAALRYIGPTVDTKLAGKIRFYQPNSVDSTLPATALAAEVWKQKPQKDSVIIEGELRIPIERMTQKHLTGWVFSPLARLVFETQIYPNAWMTPVDERYWFQRLKDLRLFLGASAAPAYNDEVVRAGAIASYSFTKPTPDRAFGAGFEVAGNTGYSWGPVDLKFESALRYLFPIANVPFDDRDRLGLVWIIDGKAEVGIIGGLSASALVNFTMANAMITQSTIYTTTVVGLALSYGDRFKWVF